jgi:purine-binding chemotaxis protein CheW
MSKNKLTQYVVFKVGKEMYSMNIEYIERIVSNGKIRPIPNTKKEVKGIVNIQEEIVPVVDLRIKFELESDKLDNIPFIIVSRVNDVTLGLVVDEVIEVINITDDTDLGNISGNVVGKASEFIQGIHKKEVQKEGTEKSVNEKDKEYELIVILDANKLLGLEELKDMEKIKKDHE